MVHLLLSLFLTLVRTALPAAADDATVTRVVDGDTLAIFLNGQSESVRLIGVDTPEVHDSDKLHRDAERTGQSATARHVLGQQASDFVKTLVRRSDQISLEYDQQRRDVHGRLLSLFPRAIAPTMTIACVGGSHGPITDSHPQRGTSI